MAGCPSGLRCYVQIAVQIYRRVFESNVCQMLLFAFFSIFKPYMTIVYFKFIFVVSHNSNLLGSAFTQSSPFESMRQSLDTGNNVYIDKIRTCSYGSVRYLSENADKENFAITREFARDVCALPETIGTNSSVKYMRFLDKWGTVSLCLSLVHFQCIVL